MKSMISKPVLIICLIIVVIGGAVWFLAKNNFRSNTVISPSPQIETGSAEKQAVKEAFVSYFGKSKDQTTAVGIEKIIGDKYVLGNFQFDSSDTGVFYATKKDSKWEIALVTAKGANPPCLLIEPYNFPKEIVGQCTNPDGTVKVMK